MSHHEYPYAGLILPDERGLAIGPYLDTCQQVLARLDPRPVGVPKRSEKRQAVLGNHYGLRVRPEADGLYGPRVVIDIITRDGSPVPEEVGAKLLSDTVLAALEHSPADTIEWYSPDTLLDAEDFIRLRNYTTPRRRAMTPEDEDAATRHAVEEALSEAALYDVEDDPVAQDARVLTEEQQMSQDLRDFLSEEDSPEPQETYNPLARMKARMAEQDADQKRLGAAAWLMSGMLAVVCFPVAAIVWLSAIWKGIDFRLTTQVLSVTMLFVALANSNRIHLMLGQILN
ncbi:hypothetical protein [Tropicibacter sp. S64]|uniref:hypothetical protein n=1 Tax=Tropicibacter sp. S64 TaxID=3415122 RepID=UPI003C7A46F6